jgi:hypothetical protein
MTNVAPGSALIVNCPSRSVMAPFDVPFCTTEAPITGSPIASITVPEKFCFWAKVATDIKNANSISKYLFCFILWFLIISEYNYFLDCVAKIEKKQVGINAI